MKLPKITAIIPTYNRAHYLGIAIKSVLEQTFDNFELIVVDDGSSDNTRELVEEFSDQRIRYVYQKNRGISAAMNTGIRAARGCYVARLDSDDMWLPDMLETLAKVLDAHPKIGLAYGKAQAMNKDGEPFSQIRAYAGLYPEDSLRSMLCGDCICNIAILVRRSCFEKAGLFDESLLVNEDWDMWLRVALHYPFAFVDQVLARYRYHDGNITNIHSTLLGEHFDGRRKVLDKFFNRTDLSPEISAMKPEAYHQTYLWVGNCWLGLKEYQKTLLYFFKAVWVSESRWHSFLYVVRWLIIPKITLKKI